MSYPLKLLFWGVTRCYTNVIQTLCSDCTTYLGHVVNLKQALWWSFTRYKVIALYLFSRKGRSDTKPRLAQNWTLFPRDSTLLTGHVPPLPNNCGIQKTTKMSNIIGCWVTTGLSSGECTVGVNRWILNDRKSLWKHRRSRNPRPTGVEKNFQPERSAWCSLFLRTSAAWTSWETKN